MYRRTAVFLIVFTFSTTAWGQGIEKRVAALAEDATVFIKLKAGKLQGSGSGFVMTVAGDTVLIMTNRHVASPAADELPPGAKVSLSVVFRSGTPQQQELPARLVAYDEREVRDLAVIEVKGVRSPPAPISAVNAIPEADLYKTMPVFALGFPLGRMIQGIADSHAENPEATVTTMSVSSLRRDDSNRLARIQLDGPTIEGNSGGPLVDAKGRLAGVVVARIRGEAVGFAVPPNVVAAFLGGDVGSPRAQLTQYQGTNATVKVNVRLVDPLSKLKAVALRFGRQSAGDAGKPQPDAAGNYPRLQNQGAVDAPLAVGSGMAVGQITVPVASAGDRKIVVQFVLTDLAGRLFHTKPVPWELPERPGMIMGSEDEKPRTLAKWSCEVNKGEGVKFTNTVGVTTITTPGEEPMVNGPQFKLHNAPAALVRVEGDFVATVAVTNEFDPGTEPVALPGATKLDYAFQGAGLLIWQDDQNFVRFERMMQSDRRRLRLIHRMLVEMYKNGREVATAYTREIPRDEAWKLLAVRKGSTIQMYAESPHVKLLVREFALDYDKDLYVGVSASNLSKHEFEAKFENFTLIGADGNPVPVQPVSMVRLDGGPVKRSDGVWEMEGAGMRVLKKLGSGSTRPQKNMDKFEGKWSDNRQLLWSGGKQGDALVLELPVDAAGKFELKAKFTLSPDYGKVNFALDSKPLVGGKSYDFYYKDTRPAGWLSLGTLSLDKGKHRFTVTLSGKNANSSGYSFGLDELQLVPANATAQKK